MAKIVWIDLETSGTDPKRHGILEIGAVLEIDGKQVSEFQTFMKPADHLVIDMDALAVNGINPDDVAGYPSEADAREAFLSWLGRYIDKYDRWDKALIGGYNFSFDYSFLLALWERAGDKYFGSWFRSHIVDLRAFAAFHLRERWDRLPNGRLMTVCREILGDEVVDGILSDNGDAHTALTDIKTTMQAFHAIVGDYK